jgi:hypothetical protein
MFPQAVERRADHSTLVQEPVGQNRRPALLVFVLTQESPEAPAQAKLGNNRGYGLKLKCVHAGDEG